MDRSEFYIPIVFFVMTAAVLITMIASRHRERITMIEKGMSSEDIKALFTRGQFRTNPLTVLKWGLLLVFVGLGILLGNYLDAAYGVRDGVMVGLVALFGGIGLTVFYGFAAKKGD